VPLHGTPDPRRLGFGELLALGGRLAARAASVCYRTAQACVLALDTRPLHLHMFLAWYSSPLRAHGLVALVRFCSVGVSGVPLRHQVLAYVLGLVLFALVKLPAGLLPFGQLGRPMGQTVLLSHIVEPIWQMLETLQACIVGGEGCKSMP